MTDGNLLKIQTAMKKNTGNKSEAASLRKRAEALLKNNLSKNGSFHQDAESMKLFHELQVHQLELEMQNEELRRAEEALRENEARLNLAMQKANMAWWEMDIISGSVTFGEKKAEMLGYPPEKFHHYRDFTKLLHPDDYDKAMNAMGDHINGKRERYEVEYRILTQSGEYKWFLDIGSVVRRNPEGQPLNVTGLVFDITERKQAEEKLISSESILRLFIEHSPAAIAMFDCDMRYIITSRRFLLDYDIGQQNIIGRIHYEIFPEIQERWKVIHRRCLSGATERCEEDPFPRMNGKIDWIQWEICPWYDNEGKIGGLILFSEVITKRKKAEENLHMSMQLTQNIIDNSPSLFYLLNLKGEFLLANRKLEKILGVSQDGLLGKTRESFMPQEIAEAHRRNDLSVINAKVPMSFEEVNIGSDGRHYYITEKFPLFDSDGNVYALGGISTDISERKKSEEAVRLSKEKWQSLFEILPVGVSVVDSTHKIIELNSSLGQILDITKNGLLEGEFSKRSYLRSDNTLMNPEEFPSIRALHENTVIRDIEIGIKKEDESIIWTNVSAAPLPLLNAAVIVTSDITKNKRAEDELRKSEEKWRSLVSNSPDYIALHDREGRFLFLNRYAEGFSEKEVVGQLAFDHVALESREIYRAAFEKCITTMSKQEIEYGALGNHSEVRIYESSLVPFIVQGNVINVLVVARDITERKKTEEEFLKSKKQLAELFNHLSDVREEERTNMAREIHDDLGQSLAGLKLDLIGLKEDIIGITWLKERIDRAISLVDFTIKTVRKLSSDLRPQMLDELGLASAIEWQSKECIKRTGIKCNLEVEEIENLDGNIAISLFRIFQASLTNIMLHSQAKSVNIRLGMVGEMLQLSISDDGIGITQEQLNSVKSFGIIGMRERANQINGTFNINTQLNKGTKVSVTIDFKRREESL